MGNEARTFRIKVTQIMEAIAPPDCLQFHEGKTGFIKSFNYDDTSKVVRKRFPSYFVSIYSPQLSQKFLLLILLYIRPTLFTLICD